MASAEREPVTGVLGAEPPAGVQAAEPPVGRQGAKTPPLKLNAFLYFACPKKAANLLHY